MENQKGFKEALLWHSLDEGAVKCDLCNFRCLIKEGKMGNCFVRQNIGGKLYSLNYDRVCAAAVDPIEKKPLFHFFPGSRSFSIACEGCNFKCLFCQNWQISQGPQNGINIAGDSLAPEKIVHAAIKGGCQSISYTYTEPTIFMELASECGTLAKKEGLKNVFVSNGYMTKEAIDFASPWLDAINIDLKSFSEEFYKKICKASLKPVLETIKYIAKNTNIWMELTTLIVPGQNDSDEELKAIADFIVQSVSEQTPWHISRFYPNYRLDDVMPTPEETLGRAVEIAQRAGIKYVYVGNLPGADGENTFCPECKKKLINRVGYKIFDNKLKNGNCSCCGSKISGIFK